MRKRKLKLTPKEKLDLRKLRVHVKELKIRITDIEAHLGEVASLSKTMTAVDGSVGILIEHAKRTPEELKAVTFRLEHLFKCFELAFKEIPEMDERLGDIERSLSSLAERADQIPDGLAAIVSRLELLETSLAMPSVVMIEELEARFDIVETRLKEITETEQHRLVLISERELSGVTTPGWQRPTEYPYQAFSEPSEGGLGSYPSDGPPSPLGPTEKNFGGTGSSDFEDQAIRQPSCEMDKTNSEEMLAIENATTNGPLSAEIEASTLDFDPHPVTHTTLPLPESVEEERHGRWFKKMTAPRKKTGNASDVGLTRNTKNNNDADEEMIELLLAGPAKQFRRENLRETANWIGTYRFATDPEECVRECCVLDISAVGARLELSDATVEEIVDRQIIFSDSLRGEIRHAQRDEHGMVRVGIEFLNFAQDVDLAREAQIYVHSLKRDKAGST